MSRQARQQSNTGVYHVIQRGVNRMLIFHEDADRRMFLDLLKSQAGEFFKVYCFCLMDNHIHLIVKTAKTEIIAQPRKIIAAVFSTRDFAFLWLIIDNFFSIILPSLFLFIWCY